MKILKLMLTGACLTGMLTACVSEGYIYPDNSQPVVYSSPPRLTVYEGNSAPSAHYGPVAAAEPAPTVIVRSGSSAHYGPPPSAPVSAHYGPPPSAPANAHYGPPPSAAPSAHYGAPVATTAHYGKPKPKTDEDEPKPSLAVK